MNPARLDGPHTHHRNTLSLSPETAAQRFSPYSRRAAVQSTGKNREDNDGRTNNRLEDDAYPGQGNSPDVVALVERDRGSNRPCMIVDRQVADSTPAGHGVRQCRSGTHHSSSPGSTSLVKTSWLPRGEGPWRLPPAPPQEH